LTLSDNQKRAQRAYARAFAHCWPSQSEKPTPQSPQNGLLTFKLQIIIQALSAAALQTLIAAPFSSRLSRNSRQCENVHGVRNRDAFEPLGQHRRTAAGIELGEVLDV
jgi:hypothetical protein